MEKNDKRNQVNRSTPSTALHYCTGDLLQSKLGVCGEGWVRGGGWSNHLISKLARSVLVAASCSCVPPSACCTIIASSASTFGQPGHTGHTGYWGRGEEPWRWSLSCKPRLHQTRPPIVIRRLKWPLSVATVSRENNKRMQHRCNSHFWWLHLSRCLSLSTCDLWPGRHQAHGS